MHTSLIIIHKLKELGLEEEEDTKKDEKDSEPHTLVGSRATEHGANTEYLYDQFELLSPVTKRHQIVLLKVMQLYNYLYRDTFIIRTSL